MDDQNTPNSSRISHFEQLSAEEKQHVLHLLSMGRLSAEERDLLAAACARSRLTEEEKKRLSTAFALSRLSEEERSALLLRQKQQKAARLAAKQAAEAASQAAQQARAAAAPQPEAPRRPQTESGSPVPPEAETAPLPQPNRTGLPGQTVQMPAVRTPAPGESADAALHSPRAPLTRTGSVPQVPDADAVPVSRPVPEPPTQVMHTVPEDLRGRTDARAAVPSRALTDAARRRAEEEAAEAMTQKATPAEAAAVRAAAAHPEHGTAAGPLVRDITPKKKKKKPEPEEPDNTALTSLLKGIVYIVAVLIISIFASWTIIEVGNDVYAFVKSDEVVSVVITEDMTVEDVADLLYENEIIKYPTMYELYIRIKKRSTDYLVGEYEISPSMNYKQLNRAFTYVETTREQVVVTIPEGYTTDQIIDLLLSYGIGTKEGFVSAINDYAFDEFRFMEELPNPLPPERKYRLEGYLFPDTYFFFKDDSEVAVIHKILLNFDRKFSEAHAERAAAIGLSIDEAVTLASMIQAEGTTLSDFENISSVFHNRLDRPKDYPLLQSDATLQYILEKRRSALTAEDLKIKSGYNSYLTPGLPPSAICNPGLDAIDCALYPAETKYYYFLADKNGTTYFSETLAEHEALKAKYIDN